MSIESAILRTAADSRFSTKTITLYKYITPIALAGLIQHGDIKLTYRKDANDPFECLPGGFNPDEDILDHLGILSLTSKWDNHPMWGNYADKYRGACIEFKISYFYISPKKAQTSEHISREEELALFSRDLRKVGTTALFFQYWEDGDKKKIDTRGGDVLVKCEYSTQRSNSQNFHWTNTRKQEIEAQQKLYRQICTKHRDWKYESEYRVTMRHSRCSRFIVGPPSMYFSNAFTRYITRIILGPKCEYTSKEVEFLITKQREQMQLEHYIPNTAEIVQAQFNKNSFDLEIIEEDSQTKSLCKSIF